MLKVFGRKKSTPAKPEPPPPPPPAPAPARVVVSRPRQLGAAQPEQPPPLYARFATRGESIDSSTAGSLRAAGNKTRPSLPEPQDSLDDLRAEYAKSISSSRIYGNDSVTRFGSGSELPLTNTSKDESTPVIVTKKRTPAPSRLGSNDSASSAQPSQPTPSRSVSGPVALTAPRLVTRRQASTSIYLDEDLPPPRAPALYTRGASSSTSTVNSVVQSPVSNYEDELSRSPPNLRSGFKEPPKPSSPAPSSTRSVVVKKEKSLPVPPPSGISTPTASRPVSIVSNTTTITAPVKVAPSAASLVHPAFKRALPSSNSTVSVSALVHPSQRLRSASGQAGGNGSSITTRLTASPQTVGPPSQLPIPSRPAVVKKSSTTSSVPLPTPEPAPEPSRAASPPPVVKTPPATQQRPESPVTPVRAPPATQQRPGSPVTPAQSKHSAEQSSPSLRSAARTPSPTSAPPSAHKDPILASVKRLSRRLSAEFGTYDIAAARKERERLLNAPTTSKDRDLPPTPPSHSRTPSPTKIALRRASMVIGSPSALTDVLRGFVKDERDKRDVGSSKAAEEHKVTRNEKKRQSIAPADLPTPPFSNDESSDGGKPNKGKGKEVVREQPVPASLERRDTIESGGSSSRESRSRVTSAETITPQSSRPPLAHQLTSDPRTSPAPNMTQLASQASSVSSANSSMFSAAMTENTKRTSVSFNEPRNSAKVEPAPQQEDSALPPGQAKRQSWFTAQGQEDMILAPVKIRKKRALPKPGEIVTSLESAANGPSSATTTSARSPTQPSSSRPLPSPMAQASSSRDRTDSQGESRLHAEPTRKVPRPLPFPPLNGVPPSDAQNGRGPTPVSPHPSHAGSARPDGASHRSKQSIGSIQSSASQPPEEEPKYYPLDLHLLHPDLLPPLLNMLSFRDALPLLNVNMTLKRAMEETPEIREAVLERFLGESVGYRTWSAEGMGKRKEPLYLTLRDLNSYMRGISLPLHHYSTVADNFLTALAVSTSTSANASRGPVPKHLTNQVRMMASSTRAYSKIVVRLRAQAEAEEAHTPPAPSLMMHDNGSRGRVGARGQHRMPATGPGTCPPTSGPYQGLSRRSPSPAFSFTSYDRNGPPPGPGLIFQPSTPAVSTAPGKFRSPLYRSGHAPLLRVFVPSPEGAWLSDQSVVECERELKRAGLIPYLKVGDVIHDLAAGDEANTGRLIWDGNYLIDLDYSYSPLGEIPKYIDSLAFPPSYFHKIVRSTGNPIVYLDLAPFAADIATHLQLLQDRVHTETPQGGHHSVVRWVHRARFRVRPGAPVSYDAPPIVGPDGQSYIRLIDASWHGIVVIDAEGTNEGLADLQGRIGNSVTLFATKTLTGGRISTESLRSRSHQHQLVPPASGGKSVFRLLRDKSRPGEIWLRCVREKERLQ